MASTVEWLCGPVGTRRIYTERPEVDGSGNGGVKGKRNAKTKEPGAGVVGPGMGR